MRNRIVLAFCLVGIVCVASAAGGASFQGIGDLPGGAFSSAAFGVSGDGQAVVGWSEYQHGIFQVEAYCWTHATGMFSLGDLPGGNHRSGAAAASLGGEVIVGHGWNELTQEAVHWTESTGMVGLGGFSNGQLPSGANDVSANGEVVVGFADTPSYVRTSFIWTAADGMTDLGSLPGGESTSEALAVSADGRVVVGIASTDVGKRAYAWTRADGMQSLGVLPNTRHSFAHDVSADGTTAVGLCYLQEGSEAFIAKLDGTIIGLGDLPGGLRASVANAVSADGTIVVGQANTEMGSDPFADVAMIWDSSSGMRNLHDVLVDDYGLSLDGWFLRSATGLSDDGRTIVGIGTNPDGNTEGWIVTIPEPASGLFLLTGVVSLLRKPMERRKLKITC